MVEALEDRELPANVFVLDFTPDRIPREGRQPTSFASLFRPAAAPAHYLPAFLDFDHNGRITPHDVRLAVRQVVAFTKGYFAPFDVEVVAGDVGRDTNVGRRRLRQNRLGGDTTYVMYVGGASTVDFGILGESYQAPVGFNLNYYGFTYSTAVARYFQLFRPHAGPADFAREVAATVAHELGHLLGLGHPLDDRPDDDNLMNHNANVRMATFPDRPYAEVDLLDAMMEPFVGVQNPAAELRESLAGQPRYSTRGLIYFRAREGHGLERLTAVERWGPAAAAMAPPVDPAWADRPVGRHGWQRV